MSNMDPMAAIRVTFFQECEEQLAELETGLLALDNGEGDAETVNAVFRAVHSVKGGAGAFGLDDLVRFAHVFESTLEDVRGGKLAPSSTVLQVLLRSADVLADLVRAARDGGSVDVARTSTLVTQLEALIGSSGGEASSPAADEADDFGFQPLAAGFEFEPLAIVEDAGPQGLHRGVQAAGRALRPRQRGGAAAARTRAPRRDEGGARSLRPAFPRRAGAGRRLSELDRDPSDRGVGGRRPRGVRLGRRRL